MADFNKMADLLKNKFEDIKKKLFNFCNKNVETLNTVI